MRMMFLSLVSVTLASCSKPSGEKPVFPTSGQLLFENLPVANATVYFHSDNGVRPSAKTDAAGRFKLTTYRSDDGAPEGAYRVTVELWLSPGGDGAPVNKLSAALAKPETSGLTATVNAAPTELPPLNLKR